MNTFQQEAISNFLENQIVSQRHTDVISLALSLGEAMAYLNLLLMDGGEDKTKC